MHKDKDMKNNAMNIDFFSQGLRLSGRLHLPKVKNPPLVVGSHGLEGSKESAKQVVLSKLLPQNGIAFFRFDHRGCGDSQGEFIRETSLEKRTQDLLSAVTHVHSLSLTNTRTAVFGSSMGGATCISAWESLAQSGFDLCGGVLCAAPLKSLTIKKIPTQSNGSRPALPLSFFAQNLLFDLSDRAKQLSHIMLFHGDADDVVPVENAHDIYNLSGKPKELIIQKNGRHQMTLKTHQDEFEKKAIAWFIKCLSP